MPEAREALSVDTIKQLLKTTAVDLGQIGPYNDYGWGGGLMLLLL
jgi:hypothetical protein